MKQNVSTTDRFLRALFAVVVAILYLTGVISGTIASLLGLVAVVLLATSIVGMCPIYSVLKISTKKQAPVA
ncbi:MAG TPA: DUF2892 domain-containing protein [Bacteroidota bacterium]|nr:DUF2892 domain-containing protein [Bacteroidota bacterium]